MYIVYKLKRELGVSIMNHTCCIFTLAYPMYHTIYYILYPCTILYTIYYITPILPAYYNHLIYVDRIHDN